MPSSGYLSQRLGRLAFFSSRRSPRFGAEQLDSKLIESQVEKLLDSIRVRFGAEQPDSKPKALELEKIQFSDDALRAKLIKRPPHLHPLEKLLHLIRVTSGAEQPDSKAKALELQKIQEQPDSKAKALKLQKVQFYLDAYRAKLIKRPSDRLEKLLDSKGGGVRSSGFQDIICWNCQQPGHMSRDCMGPLMMCHNCGGRGHLAYECPWGRFMDRFARRY